MRNPHDSKTNKKTSTRRGKFIGAMSLLMVAAFAVTACATGQSSYDDSYDRGGNSEPRGSYNEE